MADFSRQGLKKNELEDLILGLADWAKNNRQLFSGIAATVAAVIALTIFFFARYHIAMARADDKLAFAQANFYQGKDQEGVRISEEIMNQYAGTAADYKARIQKANYLLEIQKYDEAETTIMPVVEKGKPKTIIPLAMAVLGAIQEDAGKYKVAINTYNSFLDNYPEHYITPKIYESLARVYEITGSTQDAKTTYEKLAALYPSSGWAQRAQERIAAISNYRQTPAKPK